MGIFFQRLNFSTDLTRLKRTQAARTSVELHALRVQGAVLRASFENNDRKTPALSMSFNSKEFKTQAVRTVSYLVSFSTNKNFLLKTIENLVCHCYSGVIHVESHRCRASFVYF